METKFDIGEEVYLKCKVLGIHAHKSCGTSYTLTLPEGNVKLDTICLESDLVKIPEDVKTKDYKIEIIVPNVAGDDYIEGIKLMLATALNFKDTKFIMTSNPIEPEEKDDGN